MTTQTFTFRQLEADPTLCAGMRRLWQDCDARTVTFSVPDASDAPFKVEQINAMANAATPKPKAKGKKK